jgi:radical SAM superfamily enzyme YgiQ (UPF0313 family)
LIDFSPYLAAPGVIRGYSMSRVATIFSTRGCPYGCIYCGSHNIFGRRIRYRPVDDVVGEIAELRSKFGVRGIYFCDDLFTLDKQWVLDFCDELTRRLGGQIKWACQTRVDAVHVDIMKAMREAGCVQIDFGVESGSDKVLKILSRKVKRERIVEAFVAARKAGLRTCATFIIGSPEERSEDIEETSSLAKLLGADYTAFYYATPYPGTKLYDLALANQWIPSATEFDENWVHRQPQRPVLTIHFSAEELIDIRRRLANPFFARNYLRLRNLPFYAQLGLTALRSPEILVRALLQTMKSRRLEDGVETLFARYQYGKYERARRHNARLRQQAPRTPEETRHMPEPPPPVPARARSLPVLPT